MKTFVTQPLKYHLLGCLPREDVYQFLDSLWKPTRLFKLKIRNLKVIQFVDWLHRDRVSLNRILRISVDTEIQSLYVIQIWYLTRRGNERYSCYAVSR